MTETIAAAVFAVAAMAVIGWKLKLLLDIIRLESDARRRPTDRS